MQGSVRDSQTGAVGQNHSQLIKLSVSLSSGCALPPDLSLCLLQETLLGFVALPACSTLTRASSQSFLGLNMHIVHTSSTAVVFGEWHEHSRFHLLMFQLARQVQLELKAGRRQSCFPYSLALSLPLMQPDRELSQLKT